ncbi:TetR/AcrR family transcriptional regulator [Mycolicibacterium sp. 018/SC-01/001]|uniref:TetR/AcrR family transcriptional regulator n=1 Tax=Mycolicibacterium sp. 018/SC-01/001 TaxID=2592069 RepID=UPI00117CD97F|nr:TetR/AcrR family transcriptional regulator [Mycolicibacterium sp. 018/SC-01/001]TRW81447.1 TetR/AcrR family transcriptional regulator [Mycolicibacterium sp. 018/SC-01/001]
MSSPTRPQRADATRNRGALLAAAEAVFAEKGHAASVADIAAAAGVAKGTVFRHFASKEDLIASIVSEHIAGLSSAARGLADAPDAGEALLEFLTVAADQRRQHDLTFVQSASDSDPRVICARDELHESLEVLVGRARDAGAIRDDITEADVFLLMCAPVHAVENVPDPSPTLWRRYLAIIFDGLRPQGAHPLPHPAPVLP